MGGHLSTIFTARHGWYVRSMAEQKKTAEGKERQLKK